MLFVLLGVPGECPLKKDYVSWSYGTVIADISEVKCGGGVVLLSRISFSIIAILVLASSLIACGTENGSNGTPSAEEIANAQAAADASLLSVQDFPAGWTSEPDPDEEQVNLGLTGECRLLNDSDYKSPGHMANAESDTFIGPDQQEVSVSTGVFSSAEAAQDAYAHLTRLYEECRGQLEDGFANGLIDTLATEQGIQISRSDINVSIEDLSLASDAPESSAMRLEWGVTVAGVSGLSVNGAIDFVALRSDRIAGHSVYFALGTPDMGEEEEIINDFAGKMEQANESL